MASRRTRIKVVANIPQRRKTVTANSSTDENEKQVDNGDEFSSEEPNLNIKQGIVQDVAEEEQSSNIEGGSGGAQSNVAREMQRDENGGSEATNPEIGASSDPVSNNQIASNREDTQSLLLESTVRENVNTLAKNDAKQESGVPVRRKFIKPSVSLNLVGRKLREDEEAKSIQFNHNGTKNGRIVILNEVIAYSEQDQAIVIPNQVDGLTPQENHLLKPPDGSVSRPLVNPLERDIRRLVPSSPQVVISDVEYPIPPPSPNKINRARIKAVPRLGQRHTSFSASESEDESRRNYRHRNDSVCSSASGLQDTNSIPECPSPQKPKEFNSVIQRKCRRTEQSRKLAEARRDFYLKFGNQKPDRQKLTMIDLIFYNPITNPMSGGKNKRKNSVGDGENVESLRNGGGGGDAVDDTKNLTESDEENEIPAPQIKIGPSGEIVVDEQSLVVENKAVKKNREQIQKSEIVNGDNEAGYGMYKRVKRSKDWSKDETLKFYKALNTIGTDFTLMCELFPRRTRRELKMKFKKEERVNKTLIDKAIMQPCSFDFDDFKHETEMEEKELQAIEKQKQREREIKKEAKKRKSSVELKEPLEKIQREEKPKPPKKKKPLNILSVLDDNSDADGSEVESPEDEETDEIFLETLQKPTRSGRVPKVLDKYKAPEDTKDKPKPGSLIVKATTGASGQPVYKVCMVTGEYSRRQIGEDLTSLEKALECKENGLTSLFTLSASTTYGNIEDFGEECNFTIPAEEHNFTIPAEENYSTNCAVPTEGSKIAISEDVKDVITIPYEEDLTSSFANVDNITFSVRENLIIPRRQQELLGS